MNRNVGVGRYYKLDRSFYENRWYTFFGSHFYKNTSFFWVTNLNLTDIFLKRLHLSLPSTTWHFIVLKCVVLNYKTNVYSTDKVGVYLGW